MWLLREIKERRLIPLMAAYLVTGFMALEAIDQLISYGFVPEVAYPVTLALYLFGIPSSLIFAWFHGAPGRQSWPKTEVVLQSALGIVAIVTGVYVYRTQVVSLDLASRAGLPATSIAVLPFEDVSAGGDLEYVADGITDALIDQLDAVGSLEVISKDGVLPYRGTALPYDSVARLLSVGTVITGSVDERAGQLQITTRLVDGVGGGDIDRAPVQIPAGDFLAARDSVAGSVSRLLRERLGEDVTVRELRAGTSNQEAWALAQRAERLRTDAEDNLEGGGDAQRSMQAFHMADSMLALAERADPRWVRLPAARAHAAYRRAWISANLNDMETVAEEIETGLMHANRALELDPGSAYALEQRGTLRVLTTLTMPLNDAQFERELAVARADLEAAIRRDRSLATAHAMLSFLFVGLGNNFEAVLSAERALEADAYLRGADRIYDRLAYAHYDLGNFSQAQRWCDEGRTRFPDNYRFTECQLWVMVPSRRADVDRAWSLLDELDSLTPEPLREFKHGVGLTMVAGVLRNADLPDSAASVLGRVDHREAVDPQRILYQYEAGILASTGDAQGAMDALRRWVASAPGATVGAEGQLHWWWSSLQTRPDFQIFVERN
jgi:TolB-like protein